MRMSYCKVMCKSHGLCAIFQLFGAAVAASIQVRLLCNVLNLQKCEHSPARCDMMCIVKAKLDFVKVTKCFKK